MLIEVYIMLDLIAENIGTIAVCLALCGVVFAVVFRMLKNKKKGKSSCSCGCSGCPFSGKCGEAGKRNN